MAQPQCRRHSVTVSPKWVCGAGAEGVVQGGDEEALGGEDVELKDETSEVADARKVKPMHDPRLPSREEVRLHSLTHLPYRSWCAHCVRVCSGMEY